LLVERKFGMMGGMGKYLVVPPLEPSPSQYDWPFPSMMEPGSPVMVILVPEISIGLNPASAVVPKV